MFTTSQFNSFFAPLLNLHNLYYTILYTNTELLYIYTIKAPTILVLLAVLEVIDMYLIMCYICECLKCVTNRIAAFLLYYANDNKEIQSLVLI